MSKLSLYYDVLSPPCRAVYAFMKLSAIPFQEKHLSIIAGENRTPEFLKIHPRRQLPFLTDGDFRLSESIAIVRYLADKYRGEIEDHWYPSDREKRARVDEYLEYQHWGTRLNFTYLSLNEMKILRGQQVDPKKTEELELNVKKVTHIVQKTFLGDQKFLCGNEISVADLFAASEILVLETFNRDPFDGFPKLSSWVERVWKNTHPYFAEIQQEMIDAVSTLGPKK